MADTLTGRRALITGGTSGIGRAIALAFSDAGCGVTVAGRTEAEARQFHKTNPGIDAQRLDLADGEAVGRFAAAWKRLDILVNCAGTIRRENREHDPAEFAKVIDVNLCGTMRVCAAFRSLLGPCRKHFAAVGAWRGVRSAICSLTACSEYRFSLAFSSSFSFSSSSSTLVLLSRTRTRTKTLLLPSMSAKS